MSARAPARRPPSTSARGDREQAAEAALPALSVLIVSYRCRDALRTCLRSLEPARSRLPLEVVVVDNASGDGTVAMLERDFPWVRVVANDANVGFAAAANRAIAHARADVFLFLNPDTVVPDGALENALAALGERPEVGMLGCKLVRPDGSIDHACKRGFPSIPSAFYYFLGLHRLAPRSPRFAQYTVGHLGVDEAGFVDAVNGAFMLVRREAVETVGPLDERFWMYGEDLDWCYRFWQHGWPVLYWPKVAVVHVKGGSAGERRTMRPNVAFHHSIWLFYEKHHGSRHALPLKGLVVSGIVTRFALTCARSAVLAGRSLALRARSAAARAGDG